MGNNRISTARAGQSASLLLAGLCAGVLLFTAAMALAQDAAGNQPAPANSPGFLAAVSHWFSEQAAQFNSNIKGARSKVEDLGREASVAAKSTVEGAKDAVAKLPLGQSASGHEKCELAPNGAPDCVTAADALCKAKGFKSGKSVDMTTADICTAQAYLAGRTSGEGCHTETFVSRAICQ